VFSVSVFRYYLHHKLVVIKDIHELYNLAQIRKDFIANASHELRTPLTVFNGYIEMMIDMQEADSPWEKPLAQMHQQSQRMQSIINDLLTLSAMESETLIEEKQPVNVPEILANLQKDAELMSHEKHQFVFEIDPSLKIVGYLTPLTSVFTNLISNAVRYTPDQGKITVRWYHRGKFIYFEVEDTGIGIAREHLSRITERFYRVDAARSRETGGTGLGLAIVKHILERHQAQLVIESQLGRGSHFICKFPADLMVLEGQTPKKALAGAKAKGSESR
ncbi:MAG: phosphate regulon sensor histidine kinase PhoR, partial [Hydrogenovibrio sp.]|nr:phosphate regulon sensor histidine kinase PhoR [Hydrogenovibrio sp.]